MMIMLELLNFYFLTMLLEILFIYQTHYRLLIFKFYFTS